MVTTKMDGRDELKYLSYEEVRQVKVRKKLLEMLSDSEEDAEQGRTVPAMDTFNELRALLQE